MKRTLLFALAAATLAHDGRARQQPAPDPQTSAVNGCAVCHGEQALAFERSVHATAKLSCVDCHGGDPGALELPAAHGTGVSSLADARASVASCGSCHANQEQMRGFGLRTDQLALYWTSAHGRRLLEEGDAAVATCASCHGVHDVLAARDPLSPVSSLRQPATCGTCHADAELMARYELDPVIPADYAASVHGRALLEDRSLASPTCATCHGAHGSTPPRVSEVGRVCGQCHVAIREHFEAGPHQAAVLSGKMGECVGCHGVHGIGETDLGLFVDGGEGHCGACHEADSAALSVAHELHGALAGFDARIAETEKRLARGAQRGLFLGPELAYFSEALSVRAAAVPVTHALSPAAVDAFLERGQGMLDVALESLVKEERGLRDRRIFTSIFLGLAAVLSGLLLLYRREISGGWVGRRRARGRS